MDKKKDLLENEQFLRIQKLNAADAGKRQSITVDDEGELYGLDTSGNSPANEHTATTITQNHSVVTSNGDVAFIPGTATEDNTEIVTEEVIETDDNMFKTHVKTLSSKEKARYRQGSSNFISYFDDMSFEHRPSILDGSVNEPFKTKFVGPTLEKEIRRREKELMAMRKNLHHRKSSQMLSTQ